MTRKINPGNRVVFVAVFERSFKRHSLDLVSIKRILTPISLLFSSFKSFSSYSMFSILSILPQTTIGSDWILSWQGNNFPRNDTLPFQRRFRNIWRKKIPFGFQGLRIENNPPCFISPKYTFFWKFWEWEEPSALFQGKGEATRDVSVDLMILLNYESEGRGKRNLDWDLIFRDFETTRARSLEGGEGKRKRRRQVVNKRRRGTKVWRKVDFIFKSTSSLFPSSSHHQVSWTMNQENERI